MPRTFLLILIVLAGVAVACGGGSAPSTDVIIATIGPQPIVVIPTPEPAPRTSTGEVAPTTGSWIDVDVVRFRVRLMDGTRVVETIEPVAVGEQVDTGVYESTQTGLFHVYVKTQALTYDAPYNTYISDWVGFDPDRANGFHSFLKDASGKVVNPGTGRISNGCIRTSASDRIFAFAQIGMPVFVHS